MAYDTWEREHDENLIKSLRDAKFVEERVGPSEIIIRLAHLTGRVSFCDGRMYWGISGNDDYSGCKDVDQQDIDRSAKGLENYGRKAVKSSLEKIADKTIASAKQRMEAAQ